MKTWQIITTILLTILIVLGGNVAKGNASQQKTLSTAQTLKFVHLYEHKWLKVDSYEIKRVKRSSNTNITVLATERFVSLGVNTATGQKFQIELKTIAKIHIWISGNRMWLKQRGDQTAYWLPV